VRRGCRSKVAADWADALKDVQGLTIVGNANPYRLRIEATEPAIEVAKKRLASVCRIEPVQPRYVLAEPSAYGR